MSGSAKKAPISARAVLDTDLQHVVTTYDGNVDRLYRNGVEIASALCGRLRDWDAADPLVIGSEISYHRGWA